MLKKKKKKSKQPITLYSLSSNLKRISKKMPKHELCSCLMLFLFSVLQVSDTIQLFCNTSSPVYGQSQDHLEKWKGPRSSHTWDTVIASGIKNSSMRYSMARQNSCQSPHWCTPLQTGSNLPKSTVWQHQHRMLCHSISREIHCPVCVEMTWHNENMIFLQTTT